MSVVDDAARKLLEERAGHRCEYCRLLTRGQVATFPIDHIIPRTHGGHTEIANLALACPHCNAHKWAHTHGTDPNTGLVVALFHPRQDPWEEHFRWSVADDIVIEGVSARGRATVSRLQMNHPSLIEVRRHLRKLGLPSPTSL